MAEPAAPEARWILAPSDAPRAQQLAAELDLPPLLAQLLLNRGIADLEAARRYLAPRLSDLRRPDGEAAMAGFRTALERLTAAVLAGQTVGVFGDYDADGITSAALLTSFLRGAGAQVAVRVARRDAGYGFGVADAEYFAVEGAAVIVTCDCGTSDHEAIAHARQRGLDVVVVDHHQVPERDPGALALINPHQASCRFPFKGLASVGVAFYLAAALRTALRAAGRQGPDPRELLDLVAIGTVGDLAPLTEENRILVHAGLRALRAGRRPGLRALARAAGLELSQLRTSDIGMRLGPRLNAPGRLGDAKPALELLLASSDEDAAAWAERCEEANRTRQQVQAGVVDAALAQAATLGDRAGLVVAGEGWHPGVVGIVAAKLVDRYARPALVIALEGATGRGSARTIPGVHLVEALQGCADLLVRFGGHAAAAGVTVDAAQVPELALRFDAAVRRALGPRPAAPELRVDAELPLSRVEPGLAEALTRLEPFGVGNPEPCFVARDVVLERSRVVGQGHLQITLRSGVHSFDGIAFRLAERDPGAGARIRAAFIPEMDSFRGVRRLRLRLRDLQAEEP